MKSFIFILGLSLVFFLVDNANHQNKANFINKLGTTWNSKFYKKDISTSIISLIKKENMILPEKTIFKSSNDILPDNYDLREAFPHCGSIREIRGEGSDSWSFPSTGTMSDRICIISKGSLQTRVSSAYLALCCEYCISSSYAFKFWVDNGIPSGGIYEDINTCIPYFSPPDKSICPTSCQEGYPKTLEQDKSYGESSYSVKGEENIMKEIYENGSVEGHFSVYEDFITYKNGIYQHITGSYLGSLDTRIIGWGVDNGNKYWLAANSWGESWGEKGFFRIRRGVNECGIESSAVTGFPKI